MIKVDLAPFEGRGAISYAIEDKIIVGVYIRDKWHPNGLQTIVAGCVSTREYSPVTFTEKLYAGKFLVLENFVQRVVDAREIKTIEEKFRL